MDKKKIVFLNVVMFAILFVVLGCFIVLSQKTAAFNSAISSNVASVVIIDINPSIKLELNKDGNVVNIIPINDDAKKIIPHDYKGQHLKDVIQRITENLIYEGFTKEQMVILVSVTGDIKIDEVQIAIQKSFTNSNIGVSIIAQDVSDSAKKIAEKYEISESKASYIENIINDRKDLSFEDLKDKSINELDELNHVREVVTDIKDNESIKREYVNNGTSTSENVPKNVKDKTGEWCEWNHNRQSGTIYAYSEMLDSQLYSTKMEEYVMRKYDVKSTKEFIVRAYSDLVDDERSSYCMAYRYIFITNDWYKSFLVDSVTGDIFNESTKEVPENFITSDEALDIVLKHFDMTLDDLDTDNSESIINAEDIGSDKMTYNYMVNIYNKTTGEYHLANVDAQTGKLYYIGY